VPQQNTPPLRVTMAVPEDASVGPNPQVGWWNEGRKEWDTDGISEVAFDPDTRRLTFASVRMTALSLVQSRIVSLPYKTWVIRPLSANSASITVATAVDSVELLVTDSAVRLVAPRSASIEASHPQGMAPGLLLKTLQSYGLNLSPSPSDAALIRGLVPKDKVMEAYACKEIASIAPGFAVTHSCHNQRLPDTNIAVRTRHCTDYSQPPDMESSEAWQLVHFRMAPLLMCAFNPTAEAAEQWTDHRPAQIPSACAHLPKLLAGGAPDTCLQRCDDASPLFLETLCVRLLLRCAAAWCNGVIV
jgi:cancer susceptibility candidate protein 1